jgi:TolA-binding protein
MTFLFVILAILLTSGAAMLITGRFTPSVGIENTGDYKPDAQGFDVTVRGYRMDEVDQRIAELEGRINELESSPNEH